MSDKVSSFSETASKSCAELIGIGVAPNAAAGFVTPAGDVHVGGEADLLFDLASVTKPVFAVAFAHSGMGVSTRLGSLLDASHGTAAEDVPLELMFAHRAGFPGHLPLWERPDKHAAIVEACKSRTGELPAPPLYSDVGYMLAGMAVNAESLMTKHVIEPLGLAKTLGSANALSHFGGGVENAAPTEVRGHVHDENAWAFGGLGACGHAGLFGTIEAVLRFGRFVLDDMTSLAWVLREREGGTLRAGFDGKASEGSSAGSVLGPRSFGHLGFTGTSLWIDPETRVVVALLTNRVCPTRDNLRIREARPRVHDTLARAALG
jgi:CubicO group peptidase (beta-lactamase class C family)